MGELQRIPRAGVNHVGTTAQVVVGMPKAACTALLKKATKLRIYFKSPGKVGFEFDQRENICNSGGMAVSK